MELDELEQLKLKLAKTPESENVTDDKKLLLDKLVTQYEEAKVQHAKKQKIADWSTAGSSLAETLDKYSPNSVGLKAQTFSAGDAPDIKEVINMAKLTGIKDSDEEMSEYQKARLSLSEQRLGLLNTKEGRLSIKDDFQREVRNRLSDKEVEAITKLDDGGRILGEIQTLLEDGNIDENLGHYASKFEEASKYIPFMEKDKTFVKMQQLVGIQLADYVKSISGSAVSEEEAQRLLKNIPSMTDKPAEFRTKLATFKRDLAEAKQTYLENIGKQKNAATKYMDKPSNKTKPSPTVRRKTSDGKVALFDKKTKKFLRYEE